MFPEQLFATQAGRALCDGSHGHTPCAGQNTLLTQGYTLEIVKIVHQAIVSEIAAITSEVARKHEDGSVDPGSVSSYSGRAIPSGGIDETDEHTAVDPWFTCRLMQGACRT